MLSYQVLEYYNFVLKELNNLKENMLILFDWEKEYTETTLNILNKILISNTENYSDGTTHYKVPGGKLISTFNNIMDNFKKNFKFVDTLTMYGSVKLNITKYKLENNIDEDYIDEFFKETDNLFNAYQNFIQNDDSKEKAIIFGQEVCKYKNTFNTCQNTYQNLVNLLTSKDISIIDDDNYQEITIQLLDVEYTLSEFSEKLNNINSVYLEIANMIKNDFNIKELKISKIESGSLYSDIFGDKGIIAALALLLTKSINWTFNKFTTEGKIGRYTELAKCLKEEINLGEEMKKYGYNITDSKENIEKAYNAISKDLLNITRSSAKIKINDKIYSVNDNLSKKYLNENKKLLLDENNNVEKKE